jgi:hypothetical protein
VATPEYYDVGAVVRCSDDITVAGVLTDPTTLVVKYRSPAGTTTTKTYGTDAAVVKDSTGKYHIDITASTAGEWAVGWLATGTAAGALEYSFHVRKSRFS